MLWNVNHRLLLTPGEEYFRGEAGWGKVNRSTELSYYQVKKVFLGLTRDNMLSMRVLQGFSALSSFFTNCGPVEPLENPDFSLVRSTLWCRTMTSDFDSKSLQPHMHTQQPLRDCYLGHLHGHSFHMRPRQPLPSREATGPQPQS